MTVKADTPHRATHDGHEVLFCSAGCRTKFEANPARYQKAAPTAAGSGGVTAGTHAPRLTSTRITTISMMGR